MYVIGVPYGLSCLYCRTRNRQVADPAAAAGIQRAAWQPGVAAAAAAARSRHLLQVRCGLAAHLACTAVDPNFPAIMYDAYFCRSQHYITAPWQAEDLMLL
jgi:hypothetical protein